MGISTKITILTVLVTLITPSYTETNLSTMAPVDNNASRTTAVVRNIPFSALNNTTGPEETIRDLDETKGIEKTTQMLTARTNLHHHNSTTIMNEENTVFVKRMNQSVIESASEKSYSSESPDSSDNLDKPTMSKFVTWQQNALSSISSIPDLNQTITSTIVTYHTTPASSSDIDYTAAPADDNELILTKQTPIPANAMTNFANTQPKASSPTPSIGPTKSSSTKLETVLPTTNLETTQVKTSLPTISPPKFSPRPTVPTTITQPNSTTTPIKTTTSQTTTSTITKSATSTTSPRLAIKSTTTSPRLTIKSTATSQRLTVKSTATSPRLTIKSTTTLPRTTTTQPTTTSTLAIRATTMQATKSSSTLKATNHKTSWGSSTLTTTNQYVNEINHLNSNISELDNQVTSLTAAVVVLSLLLATSLVLIAVYYIRLRFRPPMSPFDEMNMTKVVTTKPREDERRGPFFGIKENMFRVSTATLGENDQIPVSAETFKPRNSAGNSSRGSASITIGGNIEDRSVL